MSASCYGDHEIYAYLEAAEVKLRGLAESRRTVASVVSYCRFLHGLMADTHEVIANHVDRMLHLHAETKDRDGYCWHCSLPVPCHSLQSVANMVGALPLVMDDENVEAAS